MAVLTVLALVSLVAGYQIQPTSAHTNQPFRAELLWEHFGQLRDVWREPPVRLCVLGISYFYGLAGALYLTLFEVSASIHLNGTGTASQTGEYAATLGAGHHPRQLPRHAPDHPPGRNRPHPHRFVRADRRRAGGGLQRSARPALPHRAFRHGHGRRALRRAAQRASAGAGRARAGAGASSARTTCS